MSEFSWSNPVHWDDACDSEIWLVETQDVSQDISVQREDLRNHLYQHSTASNTKGIINGRLNASWKICSLVVIHQDMCFCKTDSATYQQLQDSTANGDTGLDQGLISNRQVSKTGSDVCEWESVYKGMKTERKTEPKWRSDSCEMDVSLSEIKTLRTRLDKRHPEVLGSLLK